MEQGYRSGIRALPRIILHLPNQIGELIDIFLQIVAHPSHQRFDKRRRISFRQGFHNRLFLDREATRFSIAYPQHDGADK